MSSKDKTEVEKLLLQLRALERSHNVEIWRDRDNIDKGADWEKKLNQAMDTAFIALLFVSPNFDAVEGFVPDVVLSKMSDTFFNEFQCAIIP